MHDFKTGDRVIVKDSDERDVRGIVLHRDTGDEHNLPYISVQIGAGHENAGSVWLFKPEHVRLAPSLNDAQPLLDDANANADAHDQAILDAAQALDARLAKQQKQLRELAHISDATQKAATDDVQRLATVRKRLRDVFTGLPEIDG